MWAGRELIYVVYGSTFFFKWLVTVFLSKKIRNLPIFVRGRKSYRSNNVNLYSFLFLFLFCLLYFRCDFITHGFWFTHILLWSMVRDTNKFIRKIQIGHWFTMPLKQTLFFFLLISKSRSKTPKLSPYFSFKKIGQTYFIINTFVKKKRRKIWLFETVGKWQHSDEVHVSWKRIVV